MATCDGRPHIVEKLVNGEWKPAAKRKDNDGTYVFKCICHAQSSLLASMAEVYALASAGIVPFEALDSLSNYRFIPVDQDADDPEVTSVSEADRLLKEVLNKKPT